ncbi:uncharacterized protein UBRO_05095 [Ustilago bromivora]|uniref:Uncharacterized protein n=1 Tax=Ustilago bromivora TaxID=307758 RepID=A0A1K0G5A5_9BASI|nr:uncharacterized protein UBRO_05095 [Ustilago bromivora]SYW82329.1 uncharacterized protein UBRO2_04451 [Ustilago bromivora]
MSRIHPDRLQMISQESDESPSYEQPPTAISGQSSRSSVSSLPDDSLSGPSAGHDNGWASRRARSTSQATYLPSDSPPRPTTNASASIVRAASDPIPAELAWANRALTSTPSTPAVPSHIVPTDPRVPHSHIAPALKQLEIPSEERKLEFLLRTIEQRITLDRTIAWRWTRHDSELLLKLVSEHKTLHRGYSMRVRAMDTALASFFVFIDCYRAKRVEPEVEEPTTDALREGFQHIILDLCEDAKTHVRKRAYPALLRMSQTDLTVVKHHTSILAQLLHNDGEGELALLQDIFAQHMSLCLSEWLQVAIDDICFGDLRGVVLDFFSSVFGQKALEGIIDNGPQEAQLALHLAPVLPIADRDQYEVITNVLRSLQNVWLDTDDPSSMEEKNAARDAGAAVLWNLYLVLMDQSKTFVSGPADVPLLTFKTSELLRLIPQNSAGVFIAGGAALFNDLVKLLLGMGVPECHEVDHGFKKLSKAKIFLNELEVSTRYFFCLLPPMDPVDERNTSNKASAIHHFTPIQRIAFFRSAANLSTKVASAAKESPAELGYPGQSTAIDITKVTTRALMTHVPVGGMTIQGSGNFEESTAIAEAREAYSLLAAEALLIAIHMCESYLLTTADGLANITNDVQVRRRVKALTALAQQVDKAQSGPMEVLEAAKVVRTLGSAFFKVRSSVDTHTLMPKWLMQPLPLPAWEKSKPEVVKEPATSSKSGSRGQKRYRDVSPVQERRVDGRGVVRANNDSNADTWDVKGPPTPSGLPRPECGISIRGASRADDRLAEWEPDVYRPEPSLFARLDRHEDEPRCGGRNLYARHDFSDPHASDSYRDDYYGHTNRRDDEHVSSRSHRYQYDEPHYHGLDSRAASSWAQSRRS